MAPSDDRPLVLRSRGAWVWFGITTAICAYLLIDVFVRGDALQGVLIAPWMLLAVWFVWVFLVSPRIVADAAGATVRNPFVVSEIPWGAVRAIGLRYQTEFELRAGGRITAWGGAARGPARSRRGRAAADERIDDQLSELEKLREGADRAPAAVRRRADWPAIGAFVAIAIWAAIAVAVAR
ncbi:PH domain-containing protein [Microbacterium indicum]|uniref:PH domain-containing protein n=1 Tax=Microbacterium indicum TaxID=358100 RepID=UPI00041CCF80|nr:hypothetical protein [Microbacterium indicum]